MTSYNNLPAKIKENVRDAHRYYEVEHDWWDYTYEDAQRMGLLLGIDIDDRRFKTMGGGNGFVPNISFDDHSADFTGQYKFAKDAVKNVKSETNDEELLRIAEQLTTVQVSVKLLHGFTHECKIDSKGCSFDRYDGTDEELDNDYGYSPSQEAINQLVRKDFCDWIKKNLDAEYDYLTSDECIDQRLTDSDLDFDEDGNTI